MITSCSDCSVVLYFCRVFGIVDVLLPCWFNSAHGGLCSRDGACDWPWKVTPECAWRFPRGPSCVRCIAPTWCVDASVHASLLGLATEMRRMNRNFFPSAYGEKTAITFFIRTRSFFDHTVVFSCSRSCFPWWMTITLLYYFVLSHAHVLHMRAVSCVSETSTQEQRVDFFLLDFIITGTPSAHLDLFEVCTHFAQQQAHDTWIGWVFIFWCNLR